MCKFIIPPLFFKGKYLEAFNNDKEKWNKGVLKYKKAQENKAPEDSPVPY